MAGETTRQRYLDAVVHRMLDAGRTDLPLVALAQAAGTSDRMLVYYFKTREALVGEALDRIRSHRRTELAAALARVPRATDPTEGFASVLHWMASEDDAASVRFFYDAGSRGFGDDEPFCRFLEGSIRDAVDEATLAARRLGADEATAVVFGTMFAAMSAALAADRLATGDLERVDRTIDSAADVLAGTLVGSP